MKSKKLKRLQKARVVYVQKPMVSHVLETLGVMAFVYGLGGGFNR